MKTRSGTATLLPLDPGVNDSLGAKGLIPTETGPDDNTGTLVGLSLASLSSLELEVTFPGVNLARMVHLVHAADNTNRLFVLLQSGEVRFFENAEGPREVRKFLDIRERVNDSGNEQGLLGLAFDPEFSGNGFFYVSYTTQDDTVISRFTVDPLDPDRGDPSSELLILRVEQPFPNHNGGNLVFGPDGYLYIGLGDGGSGGDPLGNSQDPSTLLGSILRIDVSGANKDRPYVIPADNPLADGEGLGEVWAYGFRNPWRFGFDWTSGELWVGDVGQNRFEEVDLVTAGLNYGWNRMEGSHCFPPLRKECDEVGLEEPVLEYPLTDGRCAIIGGIVYRGSQIPSLHGAYVYGDHCSGEIWALRQNGLNVTDWVLIIRSGLPISAFGEDANGELYILAFDGHIYRFRNRP